MHKTLYYLLASAVLLANLLWRPLWADSPHITVQALFKDRVLLKIDKESRILRTGETSPEGVKLIRADSVDATFEINGEQIIYTVGQTLSNLPPPDTSQVVRIAQDRTGAYSTTGWINGRLVRLLIDTGANTVALNSNEADRLGVQYSEEKAIRAETASGIVPAYLVTLNTIKLGDITLRNVEGLVIEGDYPSEVLLGMTFLKRVEMRHQGTSLELRKK